MTWDGEAIWVWAPGLLATRMARRLTVLTPTAELPLVLDDNASVVVDLLDGMPLDQVLSAVVEMYDVAPDVAREDIAHLIEALARHGVVVPRKRAVPA
ncbi:MAG: PqqD family protein [Tetrasphaera sp.]|nr:PqqD family protein [Tetrasphaera sp.]